MQNNLLYSVLCTLQLSLQVATTSISCDLKGLNATLSFITMPGQILGFTVAKMTVGALNQALADPMSISYGLSLVASNPHMLPARRLMEEM